MISLVVRRKDVVGSNLPRDAIYVVRPSSQEHLQEWRCSLGKTPAAGIGRPLPFYGRFCSSLLLGHVGRYRFVGVFLELWDQRVAAVPGPIGRVRYRPPVAYEAVDFVYDLHVRRVGVNRARCQRVMVAVQAALSHVVASGLSRGMADLVSVNVSDPVPVCYAFWYLVLVFASLIGEGVWRDCRHFSVPRWHQFRAVVAVFVEFQVWHEVGDDANVYVYQVPQSRFLTGVANSYELVAVYRFDA